MNDGAVSEEFGTDTDGTAAGDAGAGRAGASTAGRYARRALGGGGAAGVVGGVGLLRGVRALRQGQRLRGLARLVLGGLLVGLAVSQRRSRAGRGGDGGSGTSSDASTVAPDAGGAERPTERGGGERAEGTDAGTRAETGAETDADASDESRGQRSDDGTGASTEGGGESESGTGGERQDVDRLGEAAFDEHSRQLPVPQRAFNQGFLSLDDEAHWGVRESDDAVLVSRNYDPLDETEGVRYVASTGINDERMLTVPAEVLDHWEAVAGGTAVVSGDDLSFVTTDDLKADDQLMVVPERLDEGAGESGS